LIGFWFFFLLLFGIQLFHDEGANEAHASTPTPFLKRVLSRDTLVFLLDPLAMVLSYYLAYVLRFGGRIPGNDQALLLRSLPIVVALKLLSLWMCRAFRHSWWRGSVNDIYRVGSAVVIGEALSILALTGLYRFNGFSRAVFVIDALATWVFLLAVRRSSSLFRDTICTWRNETGPQRRVFILGTSARAELALRFLRDQRIECAGFIDTNGGADLRRYVFGRPVLGRLDDLARLSKKHGIFEVVLPDREEILLPDDDFQSFCRSRALRLTKLGLYSDAGDDRAARKVVNA
jgi:FlaA1/EpsC-like NDP-sugar epimerase